MNRLSTLGGGAVIALSLTLLAGCQSNKMESAWMLIKEQQEQQTLMRQSEDDSAGRHPSTEPQVALSIIREAQRQGRDFASLAYIDAYEQRFGRNDELVALQAGALRRTGQDAQSEAAYRKLLSGPQAAQGWHGLGLLAGGQGDYAQAIQSLERATQLAPTHAQMLGDLGYAYLRAGNTVAARVPLGKAAELEPSNAKTLANMALLLVIEGNAVQAQQLMDHAALSQQARDQVYQLAHQMRAQAYSQTVASVTAIADAHDAVNESTGAADGRDVVMPMLQPVMERMINPPLVH